MLGHLVKLRILNICEFSHRYVVNDKKYNYIEPIDSRNCVKPGEVPIPQIHVLTMTCDGIINCGYSKLI